MKVTLITYTPEPEKIIAGAANLCYSAKDIEKLFEDLTQGRITQLVSMLDSMGHESPFEHINFTFGIEGVSRSLTHQLVRHRIASYSQKSQRYVREGSFEYIVPESIKDVKFLKKEYINHMVQTQELYDITANILKTELIYKNYYSQFVKAIKNEMEWFGALDLGLDNAVIDAYCTMTDPKNTGDVYMENYKILFQSIDKKILNKVEKQAIEDARYILPNSCETKIVATMNARALFNFFEKRCCDRSQWEIRDLANEMLRIVREVAPTVFKYSGPPCVKGPCPEGNMSCGSPKKKIQQDRIIDLSTKIKLE